MEKGWKVDRFLGAICSAVVILMAILIFSCRPEVNNPALDTTLGGTQLTALAKAGVPAVSEFILDANVSGYSPTIVDNNLQNAWGIAVTPTGKIWISGNHSSVSVIYDSNGVTQRPPVTIPSEGSTTGGAPTGVIFNSTPGFVIPSSDEVSKFIFASEDGIISAWSSGSGAINVADRSSAEAVYKGIAMAFMDGRPFLYATNFKGGAVDVFDDHFQYDSAITFHDPGIPSGFAPFGIQTIDGNLFVTFAKQKGPDNMDDQKGPGNGFIDIFQPDGIFVRRFASQGTLNSPWGIAAVPGEGLGEFRNAILVGNFGDGRINVFNEGGHFIGQLSDQSGTPLAIEGLWGLSFGVAGIESATGGHENGDEQGGDTSNVEKSNMQSRAPSNMLVHRLFFTAGPNDENDGLFGYLTNVK